MSRRLFRQGGGRFRGPTLRDFGMECCEKCGTLYQPDFEALGPMPDPRDVRAAREKCPTCTGAPNGDTGLRISATDRGNAT